MTTLTFTQSQQLVTGMPVVALTVAGQQQVSLAGIVDTGATLCQIPSTWLQQAGYGPAGPAYATVATAGGTVSLPLASVDLYAFGRLWPAQPVLVGSGGPVLIGRDLLRQAVSALGIALVSQVLHWA